MIRSSTCRSSFLLSLTLLFAGVFLFTSVNVQAQKATPPIPVPSPFTPIVDLANVIDPGTEEKLKAIYENLKQRADIEFAVVTVPTTGDQDIFDYSLALARGWGIGSKEGEKNAFLLVVAVNDRKYFTQISDHLEGDLPDGVVGQIQRERLVPQFRRGDYSQGIYDTTQAYLATLAEKRGFSIEGIDQRYAYRASERRSVKPGSSTICCGILIVLFVLFVLISASRRGGGGGRRGGGRRGGWGGWTTAWLLAELASAGARGGRWGGSSSGWSGGGGFGGGGGGFGGGGSFGGGGAGGSW